MLFLGSQRGTTGFEHILAKRHFLLSELATRVRSVMRLVVHLDIVRSTYFHYATLRTERSRRCLRRDKDVPVADRSRWIKLALVVFFIGAPGVNSTTFQYNIPADQGPPGGFPMPPDIGPRVWLLIAVIIAAVLLLGILFLLVGSIMEFVLIESLRHEEITVRRYWNRRWRQGVRLFGFRLVIGLLVLGSVVVIAALFLLPVVVETGPANAAPPEGFSIVAFLLLVPALLILAILVGLINGFTTVFVVPVMIVQDCGVLGGWRRLWPTITANSGQYLAYAVGGFIFAVARKPQRLRRGGIAFG